MECNVPFLYFYIFWRDRVCWPLLYLYRPFCIFERCLDSNPESCHVAQTYLACVMSSCGVSWSSPSPQLDQSVERKTPSISSFFWVIWRYRPFRLDLHKSCTIGKALKRTSTSIGFRFLFLIFNIWKEFRVLSRFMQKWIQTPACLDHGLHVLKPCIAPVVWSFFIDYCTAIRDT